MHRAEHMVSLEQRPMRSLKCVRVPLSTRHADRIRSKSLLAPVLAAGSVHGIVLLGRAPHSDARLVQVFERDLPRVR